MSWRDKEEVPVAQAALNRKEGRSSRGSRPAHHGDGFACNGRTWWVTHIFIPSGPGFHKSLLNLAHENTLWRQVVRGYGTDMGQRCVLIRCILIRKDQVITLESQELDKTEGYLPVTLHVLYALSLSVVQALEWLSDISGFWISGGR